MSDGFRLMDFRGRSASWPGRRQARGQRRLLVAMMIGVGLLVMLRAPWALAPLFSFVCVFLGVLVAAFVLLNEPGDVLSPGTLAALLYGASLSIGPLFLGGSGLEGYSAPYYGFNIPDLVGGKPRRSP